MLTSQIPLTVYEASVNDFFSNEWNALLCLINGEETEYGAPRKDDWAKTVRFFVCVCVCVCVHEGGFAHSDRSFIFSAPLRALSACITAVEWALATKDVHGKRVGERVEEYTSKHKHSRVGISSKRISHLIKTSAQLPGGLCHTKRLRVRFQRGSASKKKISVKAEKRGTFTQVL